MTIRRKKHRRVGPRDRKSHTPRLRRAGMVRWLRRQRPSLDD